MGALITSILLFIGANAGVKHCATMYDGFDQLGDQYNIQFECSWYNSAVNVLSQFAMAVWLGGVRDAGLVAWNAANGGYNQCSEATNLPDHKNDWNDRVSSVYVMPGCKMLLYEHADHKYWWGNYWKTNRGQMGGTFMPGHVYNLYGRFDNKVSKFHCWCDHEEWNNFWAHIRAGIFPTFGRRRTEDTDSETATGSGVSEPLLELEQQVLEARRELEKQALAAGATETIPALPTGWANNGENVDPVLAGWDTICVSEEGSGSCDNETGTAITTGTTTAEQTTAEQTTTEQTTTEETTEG